MIQDQFQRLRALLGDDAVEKLKKSNVAIFGIGGVGGYVAESLARSGIGKITLIDKDVVTLTNLNRQIVSLHSVLGEAKVEVMKKRILDINPDVEVEALQVFFMPENAHEFNFSKFDYIIDAIDTVKAKIALAQIAQDLNIPIISSMGTGNKHDLTCLEISDIYKTSVCPLARVMRTELKKLGVKKLKVVYSKENPIKLSSNILASNSFVPPAAGLLLASEVVQDLIKQLN